MNTKWIIFVICIFLSIAFGCGCYMFFAELPEYEYFLIIEVISVLFFVIAVLTFVFFILLPKVTNTNRLNKIYFFIISSLIAISILYIPCAFISCYDEYTPEMHYIENREYIQQFFPFKNVAEITTKKDLNNSRIMYTNYPGFSKLIVGDIDGVKFYKMEFTKTLNPIYNLREAFNIIFTLNFTTYYDFDQSKEITINEKKIKIYISDDDVFGYINNYGKCVTVVAENCRGEFSSDKEFAEFVYNQYVLSDECTTSKVFRDKPWYDVLYYVNMLSEPYKPTEYFL